MKATYRTIQDGQVYEAGEVIPYMGSIVCTKIRNGGRVREYTFLSEDFTYLPKYDSLESGSKAYATDTDSTYIYDVSTKSWITREESFNKVVTDISINGKTVTITKGDGSTSTQTTKDTEYTEFQGTDGMSDGVAGLVPAPKKYEFGASYGLGSDGTWRDFGQTFVSQSFAEGEYATNEALKNAIEELKKYVDQQSPGCVTLDSVYPIGSVYISANGANPNAIIGGTWEEFATGRTLIGYDPSDDDLTETGMTGGEKTHVLTVEEMPSHNHSASTGGAGKHTHTVGYRKRQDAYGKGTMDAMHWNTGTASTIETSGVENHSHAVTVESTGSGMAHNNMPPYITVRMWKRTA